MVSGENSSTAKSPEWMRHRERGNTFWLVVMRWLSLLLGRKFSRPILHGIALYFLLTGRAARRASRAYLSRCLDRPAGWFDLYRHFLAFATTIHDRVYLLNDRYDMFAIDRCGDDGFTDPHFHKQGFLLFGAHLGSFEVLRSLARNDPRLKVCMAMYPENARRINAAMAAINPRVMQDLIPLGRLDAVLAIKQKLEEGALVGVLADRATGPDQYTERQFLGRMARFPNGPFRMAAMLRYPVYFMAGLYRGGNRYEVLEDFAQARAAGRDAMVSDLLDKYAATLERHCRMAPFNWFNFYDFWDPAYASPD
jgi:hypothetical protein